MNMADNETYNEIINDINNLKKQKSSQLSLVWARFKKNKLALVGFIIISIIIFIAIFAPLISPYDPLVTDPINRLQAPSKEHLLGTDEL
jgi:peptide/nickel transport system permease protein